MLVVIGALFFAMKALVSVEAGAREGMRLPPLRWAAFATLWPGMRPGLVRAPAAGPFRRGRDS